METDGLRQSSKETNGGLEALGAGGGAGEGGLGDSGRDGCGGNAVFVHTISDGFAKGDQLIKRKVERGRIGDWRV